MKKSILILICYPFFIFSQDNKAKSILDLLSNKTKSYSSIKAEFTNTFSNTITDLNESQSGTIYLKENAYKLELESQIIISDGETNWIYLIDEEEVNITEIDDEENELNPSKIFTIYEDGYNYKFINEGSNVYQINLIPKESSPFSKVELFINKHKMQISSFNMIDKQGSNYKYTIDSFETNIEFNNDFFIFNTKEYPEVEVIDLR
tara:strand:+ start:1043 stop:1660 length:618 start_codon:yes stop_codon:yes gene_type:complete